MSTGCEPQGRWFDSQSGHILGLWARSPVGATWEATTHWYFSSYLSPSLPFSLKINKFFKKGCFFFFKERIFILSHFWSLESEIKVLVGLHPSSKGLGKNPSLPLPASGGPRHSLAVSCLSSSLHRCVGVSCSVPNEDTLLGSGVHPHSVWSHRDSSLNYICKDPICKRGHILRFQVDMNWGWRILCSPLSLGCPFSQRSFLFWNSQKDQYSGQIAQILRIGCPTKHGDQPISCPTHGPSLSHELATPTVILRLN